LPGLYNWSVEVHFPAKTFAVSHSKKCGHSLDWCGKLDTIACFGCALALGN
jgi:hypothetical protein